MTNCRPLIRFFVEANATVCSGVLLCPAALSQLFLKKSGCQVGFPRGYMDPSQFLEEVNPIPPLSKVAFMFSILYLLLVDIWKKILALFQISCKNIFRCSRRDCNSLKGTRRLPLRKNSSGIFFTFVSIWQKDGKMPSFSHLCDILEPTTNLFA